MSFEDFHLDQRLLKSISKLNWNQATDVQAGLIPELLEKKSMLINARTGSGKTATYIIPIIQNLLISKTIEAKQLVSAIILCPSKELCNQTRTELSALCENTGLTLVDVSAQKKGDVLRPVLLQKPDFIIGTPSKVLQYINDGLIDLSYIKHFVIDEVDLISGYGYKDDIQKFSEKIDSSCQFIFLSATVGSDLSEFRKMFRTKWFQGDLNDMEMLPTKSQLDQKYIRCIENEKYNMIVPMFKLNFIQGKTIIFVNNINKCFRLWYILNCFHIPSVVLNSEAPISSRNHILHEFNRGKYDLLLATDDEQLQNGVPIEQQEKKVEMKRSMKKDDEYMISRGVDFNLVNNVINFDCPQTVNNYVHRVGRTARVNQKGNSLTFVAPKDNEIFDEIDKKLSESNNGISIIQEFKFRKELYEPFTYRVSDMKIACTTAKVRQLRTLYIQKEILHSKELKDYFDENPKELELIQHNQSKGIPNRPKHLSDVPNYLKPAFMVKALNKKKAKSKSARKAKAKGANKKNNPLFSFKKTKK